MIMQITYFLLTGTSLILFVGKLNKLGVSGTITAAENALLPLLVLCLIIAARVSFKKVTKINHTNTHRIIYR
jgi:hypothetical protein